jgi:Protein of unknown function (DUF2934)
MTENRQPTAEEITHRAYSLYLERGGEDGKDVQDWVKAEQELTDAPVAESSKPRAAQVTRNSLH